MDTPALFQSLTTGSSQVPLTLGAVEKLCSLLLSLPSKADLLALPSKADLEAVVSWLEKSYKREMQAVSVDVGVLTDRVTLEETAIMDMQRITSLEAGQSSHRATNIQLQLQEATGTEDMPATVSAILSGLSGEACPPNLEFDRVHRALGPRSADPNRPHDVLCRLHRYPH